MTFDNYPPYALRGIFWGQWTYWFALVLAYWGYANLQAGGIRTVLVLTPILPALLIVAIAYWVYESCDEFLQSRILRSVASTAIILAAATLGYSILELFGFPRLSMLWVNLFGWSVFNLQVLYLIFRSR